MSVKESALLVMRDWADTGGSCCCSNKSQVRLLPFTSASMAMVICSWTDRGNFSK